MSAAVKDGGDGIATSLSKPDWSFNGASHGWYQSNVPHAVQSKDLQYNSAGVSGMMEVEAKATDTPIAGMSQHAAMSGHAAITREVAMTSHAMAEVEATATPIAAFHSTEQPSSSMQQYPGTLRSPRNMQRPSHSTQP